MTAELLTGAEADDPIVQEGVSGLALPLGHRVRLEGRGHGFYRDIPGPTPDAPVVVLLHGWVASGGLNWYQTFDSLSETFRVIAPDLRGHGRGIRSWRPFTLAACADDVAALLDHLEIDRAITVGYSMGGPVAQLLWRRHPDRVSGLVLAATAGSFIPGLQQRLVFVGMMAAAAGGTRTGQWVTRLPAGSRVRLPVGGNRPTSMNVWAMQEMRRHDPRMLLEAGNAIATFNSRRWLHEVDVPTTVVVTTKDKAVNPIEQMRLALLIPDAEIQRYHEGHTSPILSSFGPAIAQACRGVAARI